MFIPPRGEEKPRTPKKEQTARLTLNLQTVWVRLDGFTSPAEPKFQNISSEAGGMLRVNVTGCELRFQPDDGVQITKAMGIYHAIVGFAENPELIELQHAYRFDDSAAVGPVSRDTYFSVALRYPEHSLFVLQLRERYHVPKKETSVYALFPFQFDGDLRRQIKGALLQAGHTGTAEQSIVRFSSASSTGYEIESVLLRRAR